MRTRYISNTLDLEGSTALISPVMVRTGIVEGLILTVLTSAGVTGAALSVGTTILAGIAGIALSTGLNFLAQSLFRPGQAGAPRPEDVQQSVRQATAPRFRHYGRVKISGPWVFGGAKAGEFFKVMAIGHGRLDAIEQYWIDDAQVTLSGDGWVQTAPWTDMVFINRRLGFPSESHYDSLTAFFPEWTEGHKGNGVASLQVRHRAVGQADYLSMFPNGINTNYRVVVRGALVENPITAAVEWTDNAAAIVRDYITHPDGMRLPLSVINTPLAQEGWELAYMRAQEAYAIGAGGSEPRYRLWGSYQLNERPADVLGRMLQSCDGRLVPTLDGGLRLDIGYWQEPSVIIGPETITGFSEVGRGRDVLTTANTIRSTYLEPDQDYQAAEADPWADEDDVSERGEIASDVTFNMSPSHSQARRLMKLTAFRANPTWVGTFQCNLRALAAVDQRFVRIQYPLFGINSVFEVQDFRFDIGEGGILTGVTLQVQSMPQEAYQWDSSQEGTAPVYDQAEKEDGIPVPAAPEVDFLTGPLRAELTFSPSPSTLLFYQARYRETPSGDWFTSDDLANDASSFITGTIDPITQHEFQLRFVTERGRLGEWSGSTVATTP